MDLAVQDGLRYLYTGPFQPDLEDAFSSVVASLRGIDRLRPILVIVPTHILGWHLTQTIARRHGICLNVRFHTLLDLAWTVGIERLVAGKHLPLPSSADWLIARKAIKKAVPTGGYFSPVLQYPRTAQAILSTLIDLKAAGITPEDLALAAREQGAQKLLELADIYREFQRVTAQAGYLDDVERIIVSTSAAASSPVLKEAMAICLYGFPSLSRVEGRFLEACLVAGQGHAFVPEDVNGQTSRLMEFLHNLGFARASPAGNSSPRSGAREVVARLFKPPEDRTTPVSGVQIIAVPGVTEEVQEIGRTIRKFVQQPGALFHDVIVLLRHPETYEGTIRDIFDHAGIPYVFLAGERLGQTLLGRLLRLLVQIRLEDFPRAPVVEFLDIAPLRQHLLRDYAKASPSDWDRYTREAGIVSGRSHWARLAAVRRRIEWRIRQIREEGGDRTGESTLSMLESDIHSVDVLVRVVARLLKRLEAIPRQGTIGEIFMKLLRALVSVVQLDAVGREIALELSALLQEPLGGEEVSLENFVPLLDGFLYLRRPPRDVYRSGKVVIAPLAAATGLSFKRAFIPGLVERSFPMPAQQDPILLDSERAALNSRHTAELTLSVDLAAEEAFAFRHAAGTADEVFLSYPRLDSGTTHTRVPSHFLLRVAEVLTGGSEDYESLAKVTERIPIARMDPPETPLSPAEWDFFMVSRAAREHNVQLVAALPGYLQILNGTRAEMQRWGQPTFTLFDGLLKLPVQLPATLAAT